MNFEEQVTDLKLETQINPNVFLSWINTEEGRDKKDKYQRFELDSGEVFYRSCYGFNTVVSKGNPFWEKLENLYNLVSGKPKIKTFDQVLDKYFRSKKLYLHTSDPVVKMQGETYITFRSLGVETVALYICSNGRKICLTVTSDPEKLEQAIKIIAFQGQS